MNVITKGIVLSETAYGESSKILNVLTSDYGVIGIISKGCKNIKSKLRGVSGKMAYAEYTISYKEKGLSTLIEGNTINSFKNIFYDLKKANYAFYLMDLVNQVSKENNDKELFNLLESSLLKINDNLSCELISNIVELKLLDYLGVAINLDECILCGSTDIYTLDIKNGGVICIDLSKITKLEIDEEKIIKEIDEFIGEYYSTYTGIYLRDKKKFNSIVV